MRRIFYFVIVTGMVLLSMSCRELSEGSQIQSIRHDNWTLGLVNVAHLEQVQQGELNLPFTETVKLGYYQFILCNDPADELSRGSVFEEVLAGFVQEGRCAQVFRKQSSEHPTIVIREGVDLYDVENAFDTLHEEAKQDARQGAWWKSSVAYFLSLGEGAAHTGGYAGAGFTAGGASGCAVGAASGAVLSFWVAGAGAAPGCALGGSVGASSGSFFAGVKGFFDYFIAEDDYGYMTKRQKRERQLFEKWTAIDPDLKQFQSYLEVLLERDHLTRSKEIDDKETMAFVVNYFVKSMGLEYHDHPLVDSWLDSL